MCTASVLIESSCRLSKKECFPLMQEVSYQRKTAAIVVAKGRMKHSNFDETEFRVALARLAKTRIELAADLNVPYSTAMGWWTGRHPAPPDFRHQVEMALGLAEGSLSPAE